MNAKKRVFISSVQKELGRAAVVGLIRLGLGEGVGSGRSIRYRATIGK